MTWIIWITVLFAFTSGAWADVVSLRNGDRISGTVQELEDGSLVVDTGFAGQLEVDWGQVQTLSTDEIYEVEFTSGRRTAGIISSGSDGGLEIAGETMLLDEVVAIRIPPEQGASISLFDNWQATADLGYTRTGGNSRSTQVSLQFQPERRTDNDLIKADIQSLRSLVDDGASTSSHSFEGRYDRFVSARIFFFAVGKAEKDQRERLNLRTSEGGGFGYQIRPNPSTRIAIIGGSTYTQESFKGMPRRLGGEGILGYEIETRSIASLEVDSQARFLPNFSRSGRYRIEWDAAVRVPVISGLNFGLRLFHRFDSKPPADVKKGDYGIVSTFGVRF